MKANIFVDMDGVLAVYDKNIVDYMYDENYFLNRPVIKPMVKIVKDLVKNGFNVYILTSCIESPHCIPEKAAWLDKTLPEVPKENRIYVPYGEVKSKYAQKTVDTDGAINVLLDDYTENLVKWTLPGALPVKVLNGINGTKGTWKELGGEAIEAKTPPTKNKAKIISLIKEELAEAK